jgi:hypothetical protein
MKVALSQPEESHCTFQQRRKHKAEAVAGVPERNKQRK